MDSRSETRADVADHFRRARGICAHGTVNVSVDEIMTGSPRPSAGMHARHAIASILKPVLRDF